MPAAPAAVKEEGADLADDVHAAEGNDDETSACTKPGAAPRRGGNPKRRKRRAAAAATRDEASGLVEVAEEGARGDMPVAGGSAAPAVNAAAVVFAAWTPAMRP